MIQFLLEEGFFIKKIHYCIEYRRGKKYFFFENNTFLAECLSDFVNKIAQQRQKAHDSGQSAMSTVYKLITNASYGRLG